SGVAPIDAPLNLQDLGFLLLAHAVDFLDPLVREPLDALLLAVRLVAADLAVALLALDLVGCLAPVVADLDPRFLHALVDDFDQVLATLLGQRRNVQAHDGAVDVGHQADVRPLDRLLDRAEDAAVPGLDDDLVRLGNADAGELVER